MKGRKLQLKIKLGLQKEGRVELSGKIKRFSEIFKYKSNEEMIN